MGSVYEASLIGRGLKVGVVISRFNDTLGRELLRGARSALERHGVEPADIDVLWVPGAFEIPLAAKKMALTGRYEAIVCLGVVVRGATPHFEYIAGQAASGIGAVALETGVPVTFGVLTTDTLEQALERAGTKAGNKGEEAALAAIEMANVLRALEEAPEGA